VLPQDDIASDPEPSPSCRVHALRAVRGLSAGERARWSASTARHSGSTHRRSFSTARPRWGWRRAAKGLRKEGWKVNNKRIQRLWREEGLKVPYRKRKKRLAGVGTHVGAMCPIATNALWALDFQLTPPSTDEP